MSIILIHGYSQSGKDFIGNILCKKHEYTRFAFADSLKRLVSKMYGIPLDELHSQDGKIKICEQDLFSRTYRQILIDEARYMRELDKHYFARKCCQEIEHKQTYKIVITDWRFPNELEVLQFYFPNFIITPIHIIRKSQEDSPVNDISEYHLKDRKNDYTIINKMDDSIYEEVDKFISMISSNHK